MRSSWKEIRTNLKILGKAYNKFENRRRIAKLKKEARRLKEENKQRLREEEALRLQEEEDKRFKKEKKIKEEAERKIRAQEKQRLEEKRLMEQRNERLKQEEIYRARVLKAEEERIKQLKKIEQFREEERKLREERILKMEGGFSEEQKIKNKEQQKPKEEEKKKLDNEQNKKRLNGSVKWFNDVKGYGFIEREDKEKDVYVNSSAIKYSVLEYLKKGEKLTFEVEYLDKGPSAFNLQKTVNETSSSYLKLVK